MSAWMLVLATALPSVMVRAVERISVQLARRANQEDGNPDEEYFSELVAWFEGMYVEGGPLGMYQRKQERDLAQVSRPLIRKGVV